MGFRHLQSLRKSKFSDVMRIDWIDKSVSSYDIQKRYKSNILEFNNFNFLQKYSDLSDIYDLAIIAVGARNQLVCLSELSKFSKIKSFILEKNLCQSLKDLSILRCSYQDAYVNLNIGLYPVLKFLTSKKDEFKNIRISGDSSLAGNLIHYLSYIQALTGASYCKMFISHETHWLKSKRKNVFEISGSLNFQLSNKLQLEVISKNIAESDTRDIIFDLFSVNNEHIEIQLDHGIFNSLGNISKFPSYLQSENGYEVVDEILEKNQTDKLPRVGNVADLQEFILKNLGHNFFGEQINDLHTVPLA